MQKRTLTPPEGYDRRAVVTGMMAAQLDPLLASLARRVKDAGVDELEWQPRPGINTVGMLLAHLALSEVYWMLVASQGIDSVEEADVIALATIGIRMNDDGLPLAPHGSHPATLAGKTAAEYLEMLRRARQATHATLRGWDDAGLDQTRTVNGVEASRGWILFHIVEHFAHHLGQIALLASIRRTLHGG
jgi:uncharacterized damage-inducible protein DinB